MHRLVSLAGSLLLLALAIVPGFSPAAEPAWINLLSKELDAWINPSPDWLWVGGVELDAKNPRMLSGKPGAGILWNGPKGRTRDLLTKQQFADIEAHAEFAIPKGSNSGIKFMGLYELQIVDSAAAKVVTGDSCGGIYPLAEDRPFYHHIDKGIAPKVNAAKPAGEWQTLDVIFRAPRFDAAGKKIANAHFVKVVLNDQLIHENVDVDFPTGAAWRLRKETPTGPFMLQADHGPVAFRNVKVRPWNGTAK